MLFFSKDKSKSNKTEIFKVIYGENFTLAVGNLTYLDNNKYKIDFVITDNLNCIPNAPVCHELADFIFRALLNVIAKKSDCLCVVGKSLIDKHFSNNNFSDSYITDFGFSYSKLQKAYIVNSSEICFTSCCKSCNM